MNDDLGIPACLDLRNPEVAARREQQRQAPVMAMPAFVERQRNMDEESRKFWEAEKAREEIEKKNGFASFQEKKKTHLAEVLGGRYDSRTNRWITPEEEFAQWAEKLDMNVTELRYHFENSGSAFGKSILEKIDNGKLALEAEKMLVRAQRKAKRKAMANAHGSAARRSRRKA